MIETLHPTAEKLISTVSTMLDGKQPHTILVDDVLAASEVSRGALYHHFGDYPALIEATLLRRFALNIDADTQAIRKVTFESSTADEYWTRIRALSAATQIPERAPVRAERARILALAATNERFGAQLAKLQELLTTDMAEAITHAQENGWVRHDIHPRAISVLLQSYSLGRIVDDITDKHLDNSDWVRVIDTVLSSLQAVR